MVKKEMPEKDTNDIKMPEAYTNNTRGYSEWLFTMRQRLYCKAKREPGSQFYTLYGMVYREDVLQAAWRLVSRNEGAPGLDGVSIKSIQNSAGGVDGFLRTIAESLKEKTYTPDGVKRVYIPKANGKLRPLGIPTVRDRVVQMAVLLIIEPIFEADFLECSYGFRPNKTAHQALEAIRMYAREGRYEVYDADLESYFDTIPHDKLLACVKRRITDGSIIKLIREWLRALIVEDRGDGTPPRYFRPRQGTPQGGVISPLLANLYLHWFDVMFHKSYGPGTWANARLVRYADDFVILAKSIGTRIETFVEVVLEQRMGLKINRTKTTVLNLKERGNTLRFLGYVFRNERAKQYSGTYLNMLPSPEAVKRIGARLRELTSNRYCFRPTSDVIADLNRTLHGWANYFSLGFCQPAYHRIDHYAQQRLILFLKHRSQRGYRRPNGCSWYAHLQALGYQRLKKRLCPRVGL